MAVTRTPRWRDAVAAADQSAGADVIGYVSRQLGLVGRLWRRRMASIDRSPIDKLEKQRLLTAAAAHRADSATALIDFGRLEEA